MNDGKQISSVVAAAIVVDDSVVVVVVYYGRHTLAHDGIHRQANQSGNRNDYSLSKKACMCAVAGY